jgi:hypothetical protein
LSVSQTLLFGERDCLLAAAKNRCPHFLPNDMKTLQKWPFLLLSTENTFFLVLSGCQKGAKQAFLLPRKMVFFDANSIYFFCSIY